MTPRLDPERLVFLDETWTSTRIARTNGRALRGQRLVATVPHGQWRITTFVGALRTAGFTAPLVVDGAIDGPTFLAYVGQHLGPTLRPGDVLVMDNLSCHKWRGCAKRSKRPGQACFICRPTAPT
jgi:hypothetical protein